MEKIRINSIEKKGVVCIVKYDESLTLDDKGMPNNVPRFNCEATLNINFNSQEISYLENDVGIGGGVSVEITNKEKVKGNVSAGYWVNITKVDFDSAVPSGQILKEVQNGERSLNGQEQMVKVGRAMGKSGSGFDKGAEKYMPSVADERSKSIIAQCLVKAVIGSWGGEDIDVIQAVEMYKKALELLG